MTSPWRLIWVAIAILLAVALYAGSKVPWTDPTPVVCWNPDMSHRDCPK